MSLTEAALKKMSKDEVIALTLEYQAILALQTWSLILEGWNHNCLYLRQLTQSFAIAWQVWSINVELTTSTADENA